MEPLASDLKILETEGITVKNEQGILETLKGTVVALSHDNLGGNLMFGMVENCDVEDEGLLRINELYESHCDQDEEKNKFGVKVY